MSSYPTVEDLRLVDAVARHGSLGAAARELLVSQPSASQRLAALERRVGVTLFDRDTTGARPTAAGQEFREQAAHVLDHLGAIVDRTLVAARSRTVSVGTIPSLAGTLFAVLDVLLDDVVVQPEVEHGPRLLEWVERGTLDAAFVTIAKQVPIARGLVITEVGQHDLVTLLPHGAPERGQGRRPYTGQTVVCCALDLSRDVLLQRLTDLGAHVRQAATAESAVRTARERRCAVVVPDMVAHWYAAPGDRIVPAPVRSRVRLSMVTRSPAPSDLVDVLPGLRERLDRGNVHARAREA
ncbi:LysR family transcriptional regulator [Promicromonospora iranensis]|uniref:DNA-binding transcriptional LysR family regulator n=1 Tax=Promicromonospora iranensis TaxID=1105144 RepID=A0ABU2CRT0_9MICO|nr:LysR family transcriptional regulator [Promicromonospora iranensis]MDR7384030.1 DNA-binding transcriptional LysR family regulator [Promicromonospora iranensis]